MTRDEIIVSKKAEQALRSIGYPVSDDSRITYADAMKWLEYVYAARIVVICSIDCDTIDGVEYYCLVSMGEFERVTRRYVNRATAIDNAIYRIAEKVINRS